MNISFPLLKAGKPVGDAIAESTKPAVLLPPGALCHALQLRLIGSEIETVCQRFAQAIGEWKHESPQPVLWDEALPLQATSAAAAKRRVAERRLPLDVGNASGLRATLLRYTDGLADLILVADRRIIDGPGLRRFATFLLEHDGDTAAFDVTFALGASDLAIADRAKTTYPEWGLGGAPAGAGLGMFSGQAFNSQSSQIGFEPSTLIAAIGYTLSCFEGGTEAKLGLVGFHETAAAGEGLWSVLGIDLTSVSTVAQLLDEARASLQAVAPLTSKVSLVEAGVAVGVHWEKEQGRAYGAGNRRDTEYWPSLAPLFPLSIEAKTDCSGRMHLDYHFERTYFSAFMVEIFDQALVSIYSALIEVQQQAVVTGNSFPLGSLTLLDSTFAAAIVASGKGKALTEFDASNNIVQRIAQHAISHPHAQAVSYEDQRLNYAELAQFSDRIAATLHVLGVRAGGRVGVCLERSLELVPVLLAVLKLGAAYVPVDPMYPAERVAYTLQDANPSLVIGGPGLHLPDDLAAAGITLDKLLERAAASHHSPPAPEMSADTAAYIIYTSGSTGRPKGVVIPHRNVAALIAATESDFALSITDTWTMFHSSAFDFSVWEIWACLATGGHLVVVPYWVTRSPAEFVQLLMDERVTVLNQTPSAFAQLQDAEMAMAQPDARLPLRLVIFGGEALDSRMLLRWFDRYPESSCRLVNMFGITETTVHVTAETITRRHALANSRSVGRAIPGWHLYIMDAKGRLLPPGVVGEIHVGGAGVAQHYLNRDDLTAQRFLPDPYAHGTMYRSGDRGRMLADGRIEHLGRLDNQVKIRGFRIELDEIRSVLLEYTGVSAAAVVVNQAHAGDAATARLDAYVVLDAGDVTDIRRYAARKLPDHMVPGTVTMIASLPLTTNGKLDVTRLPMPVVGKVPVTQIPDVAKTPQIVAVAETVDATAEAASDVLIKAMQSIWSEVLGVEVACEDNFFELGGNSLFAMRIAAAMRERSLPRVPTRELYLHQNIRGIVQNLHA